MQLVKLFQEINFTKLETSVTLFAFCCFNITISWKQYVLKGSVHVTLFKLGSWKNIAFKILLKHILYILFCDRVPLNI